MFRKVTTFIMVYQIGSGWAVLVPGTDERSTKMAHELTKKHYKKISYLGLLPRAPREARYYQVCHVQTWFGLFQRYYVL